jgi:hypothetical protein
MRDLTPAPMVVGVIGHDGQGVRAVCTGNIRDLTPRRGKAKSGTAGVYGGDKYSDAGGTSTVNDRPVTAPGTDTKAQTVQRSEGAGPHTSTVCRGSPSG